MAWYNSLCSAYDMGITAIWYVLSSETPDMNTCPLAGRENVIITPHSAFYSTTTEYLLYKIPAENVLRCLEGNYKEANRVVNGVGLD